MPVQDPWVRYLLAKRTVDDRALNLHVFRALQRVWSHIASDPPRIVELGAGIGTMVARLMDWGLLDRGEYWLLDIHPALHEVGLPWLRTWAQERGWPFRVTGDSALLEGPRGVLTLRWRVEDVYAYAARAPAETVDLLLAHALLDLMDLPSLLPLLWRLLKPGGLAYFTLNFDAGTVFLPERPELDEDFLLDRYHASMDNRTIQGRPGGSSRTGRRLLEWAVAHPQVRVLAVGASDWAVLPTGEGAYPEDEAFFLAFILETVYDALRQDPQVSSEQAQIWYRTRMKDLEEGRLIYLAHQWDVLFQKVL